MRTLTACLLCLAILSLSVTAQTLPKKLLIYYGYPSSLNYPTNNYNLTNVANDFAQYEYVVLGDGLSKTNHPDHANTQTLLNSPITANTKFFGYIDLGACYVSNGQTVCQQNLPLSEIQTRVNEWKAMGIDGIFFDDYGYDYGVPRARQNAAVQYAHAQNLPVIANGWRVDDTFGAQVEPTYNPTGTATLLNGGDYYLSESFLVSEGQYTNLTDWKAKADLLQTYRQQIGFSVLSITTNSLSAAGTYNQAQFFYAWYGAWLYGHEATGWGEYGFSAGNPNNAIAPYRARPVVANPGNTFAGPVRQVGNRLTRYTNTGLITLDTDAHAGSFTPCSTCISNGSGSWQTTANWNLGRLPIACDIVEIQPNHVITLNQNADAGLLRLRGKLQSGNYRLQLRVY